MIWVGNIAEGTTHQELKAHAEQSACPARWAEVFTDRGKGTGAIGFASASDVGPAAAALNGTFLNGNRLEVDVWQKPDKEDGGQPIVQPSSPPKQNWAPAWRPEPKKWPTPTQTYQASYQASYQETYQPSGQPSGQPNQNWRKGNPTKMVWVGNLAEGTTFQDLLAHAQQAGKPRWAEVFSEKGKGTGAVGFASAAEVATAVAALQGTFLNGHEIQVDLWEKPQE